MRRDRRRTLEAPPRPRPRAREALAALALALALGLAVVGRAPFDGEKVLFAVDAASAQLPWSALRPARDDGVERPRNPELSDQGLALYPRYRAVAARWRAGEVPLWSPLARGGAPCLSDPGWGALDPQVLALVALDALGGRALFDRGFAWLAWLRVAAAALGAHLLARALGLGRAGAALAAVGYALSGSVVPWLGFGPGHVAPLLPWVLFGLEGLRGERRARSFLGTVLAFALAILGGHPATAFFVGLCAGAFALALVVEERRAGLLGLAALALATLLCAPALLPFLELLAQFAQNAPAAAPARPPDLVAAGAILVAIGLVWRWRALRADAGERAERGFLGPLGVALALGGVALLVLRTCDSGAATLALLPDAFGRPGAGAGFRGAGSFLERASPWLPLPALAFALVALLDRRAHLRRCALVTTCALVALLLALGAPGAADLFHALPGLGLAEPARAAPVAALMLALLAGAACERSSRPARLAAGLALIALGALALARTGPAPVPAQLVHLDPPDEIVDCDAPPARRLAGGAVTVTGRVHAGLPAATLELVVEPLDAAGRPQPGAVLVLFAEPAALADAAGMRRFAFEPLPVARLAEGSWLFRLDFRRAGGELLGSRRVALSHVARRPRLTLASAAFALATLLFVLAPRRAALAWAAVGFALVQGAWFARGANPATPRAECFPPTRTEEVLAGMLDGRRFLAGPGVLPADTGLVRGLASAGGHGVALPGERGAATWARPFGVGALCLREPRELPGWTLVAGPADAAPRRAEVFVYAADEPLPRAFCVPRIVPRERALADPQGFDPLRAAFIAADPPPVIERPFTRAAVEELARAPERSSFAVELDGEGLFVVAERHDPGWVARVDGRPAALLCADDHFRAVLLAPGRHAVELAYEPASWRLGLWLASLAGAAAVVVALLSRRRRCYDPTRCPS